MNKFLMTAAAVTAFTAVPAQAATIISGAIGDSLTASYDFTFDGVGNLAVQVDADLTSGTPLGDPQIYILNPDFSFVATDDDSGFGLNSFLNFAAPAGSYILRIGRFDFTLGEAQSNLSNAGTAGEEFVVIFGDGVTDVMTSVPEPATWAFMIFGFGAIGSAMRRQRKANVKVSYA